VKREEYWKARYDFEIQKEEIQHIEWMQREKQRVISRESEQKQIAEERENYIKTLSHPY
jgi:predicted glycosyltransferase